jgi:hypothetical protein
MSAPVTTESLWAEVARRHFACLSWVNPHGEARAAGIVYVAEKHKIYIVTGAGSWKDRHIRENSHVALTITIPKRIPFLPWIQIPQATIALHGTARVLAASDIDKPLLDDLLRRGATDPKLLPTCVFLEITPEGWFSSYGVGVGLIKMADHEAARGRAPVAHAA